MKLIQFWSNHFINDFLFYFETFKLKIVKFLPEIIKRSPKRKKEKTLQKAPFCQ